MISIIAHYRCTSFVSRVNVMPVHSRIRRADHVSNNNLTSGPEVFGSQNLPLDQCQGAEAAGRPFAMEMFEEQEGDYIYENDSVNYYPVEELFAMYARFGDARGSGDVLCLKNFEKWIKQANIKTLSPIEAVMHFSKVAKGKKAISYKEFLEAVDRLACQKQLTVETLKQKLVECGPPQPTNPTKTASLGVYDRLTDRSRYTGVIKRKFDDLNRTRKSSAHRDASGATSRSSFYRRDQYDKTHNI